MTDPIFDNVSSTPLNDLAAIDQTLAHLEFVRGYTLSLLSDLEESDWFAQPGEGISHIAWQAGHIAMSQYGLALFRQRGRAEVDLDLMPSSFRKKYSRGTTPNPDPSKNASPADILETLDKVFAQVKQEVPGFQLDHWNKPVDPPFAAFPNCFGALLFAADHEMIHAGQIGFIRRLIGKQPLR